MELCSLFFLNSKGCLLSLEAELRFVFGVPSRALLYLRGWYRKEGLGLGGNAWVGGSWVCLERSTQEGRAPTPPPPPRGGRWQWWWPHLSGSVPAPRPPTLAVGVGSGGGHTFLAGPPGLCLQLLKRFLGRV